MTRSLPFAFFFLLTLFCFRAEAQRWEERGDTLVLNAFDYEDFDTNSYRSWFEFPGEEEEFRQIRMRYKLRCPEHDCGEWDYLAYIFASKKTGEWDTIRTDAPLFRADGAAPDTFAYRNDTSYVYTIDTAGQVVDSAAMEPIMLVWYENEEDLLAPTDTQYVWPAYRRYYFDENGEIASDSLPPDETIFNEIRVDEELQEALERYEIGRYITPYGIGISQEWEFEWIFDMSDYRTLLQDSAYIDAGSLFYGWIPGGWSELLELKFEFIRGTPSRKPLKVEKYWAGGPTYGGEPPIDDFFEEISFQPEDPEGSVRLKFRVTGHGFGGTDNCAEFCRKTHNIYVNDILAYYFEPWRNDCGLNPVYPQGGTWLYDRAGWCPGDIVRTPNFELTEYLEPGSETQSLRFAAAQYRWNNQGSRPYYRTEAHLIHYGPYNFALDAALREIITPSNRDEYSRRNPVCNNPVVRVENAGSETLTELTFLYGPAGGEKAEYVWNGELEFAEKRDITLPAFHWGNWNPDNPVFEVEILAANGQADEQPANNRLETPFTLPARMDSAVVFSYTTNRNGFASAYRLVDAQDNILYERLYGDLAPSTGYADTFLLAPGCYTLTFYDRNENGLSFFAVNEGDGYASINNLDRGNPAFFSFEPDFGSHFEYHFTVGYDLYADTLDFLTTSRPQPAANLDERLRIFPNPTTGRVMVHAPGGLLRCEALDALGRKVAPQIEAADGAATLDLSGLAPGVYFIRAEVDGRTTYRKIIRAEN